MKQPVVQGGDPWAQLSACRPYLQQHVAIAEHRYRGQCWFVLTHKLAGTNYRCDAFSCGLIKKLDGSATVGEAYAASIAQGHDDNPDAAPDTEQIIRLLAALRKADMLGGLPAESGDETELQAAQKSPWLNVLLRPMAIKLPLLDPDRILALLLPVMRPFFSVFALSMFALLALVAGVKTLEHWVELGVHFDARFLDWSNAFWLWLVYPIVKLLHELGHGLAAKRWGGEVHEMGVMLLVFMPVPYVDASASSALPGKYQRMLIAAAGIIVELLLASIALLAWCWLEPGLLRDIAFNVAFVAGISTLLFNGNPLLRFDGYYVLCDAVEIPNLGTRANQYLGYLFKRYLLALDSVNTPKTAAGERRWFISYGVAAAIYRLFITFTIAMFVLGKFVIFGVILAIWLVLMQLGIPIVKTLQKLWPETVQSGKQKRGAVVFASISAIVYLALFVVPLPHSSDASGVLQLADDAPVRSEAEGFVREVFVTDGQQVRPGDKLVELEDAGLSARLKLAAARLGELKARHSAVMMDDRNAAAQLVEELKSADEEYRDLLRQSQSLLIVAARDGIVSLPKSSDLPGRFIRKGELVGHVVDLTGPRVRVVVTQRDADAVRRYTHRIEVRLESMPGKTHVAELDSDVPLATRELPSSMLGSQYGGSIAVDARDESGLTAIEEVFQFDVQLPAGAGSRYLGQSAAVRFVHSEQPLAKRIWRHVELLLQRELSGSA